MHIVPKGLNPSLTPYLPPVRRVACYVSQKVHAATWALNSLYRSLLGPEVYTIWVVVNIMVPFWILIILRHLIFRVPKKGP